ncbi:MAG: SDR family oxidoreductase [Betaproteobacteria bacterium]|nr:SDR family oxidoreductase [Rhodocyclaceae bacterium]MCA3134080.1 SDR family oxidoreductase [Rhodocyclaceae bacterium]MCA3142628.1 SDR family oxidoreductase [Rhodocyclaceae bacterium]MCA3144377.1 SDR family oxidoreductase [Rhodocyclaceae bacterium]MCE2897441.1 SDR family oxidoreductase [Betaproteobacteria bacterium]
MDLELEDKAVVITGGSKGIGFACAAAFLAEGARVALVSRSAEHLRVAAARLHSAGDYPPATIVADLSRPEDAARMAEEVAAALGKPHVLVNSAGAARRTPPDQLTAAAWHAAMDAKYFTYVHAMDALLPALAADGGGAVVNVIGMGGRMATSIHLPGGAANAALMLASVGLAGVYGPKGVRINAINPGPVMGERLEEALALEMQRSGLGREQVLAAGQAKVPLGRYATNEDIAQVTLFLASARAAYLTGAIVPMDGGLCQVV